MVDGTRARRVDPVLDGIEPSASSGGGEVIDAPAVRVVGAADAVCAVVVVVVPGDDQVDAVAVEEVLPGPAVGVYVPRRVAREHRDVEEGDAPVGIRSGQLLLQPGQLLAPRAV